MIVCVLSDLTWLPLHGGGRESWYIIIILFRNMSSTKLASKKIYNFQFFEPIAKIYCPEIIDFLWVSEKFIITDLSSW